MVFARLRIGILHFNETFLAGHFMYGEGLE